MRDLAQHKLVQPRVMYFGTPVILITTLSTDGTANLAPMSSAWWIGDSCMLGLDATSQTTVNLQRTGELVLNLPDAGLADAVDRLAGTTGNRTVPPHKLEKGYRYVRDKFAEARLTALPSLDVGAPRVAECPIHLEARVEDVRSFAGDDAVLAITVRVIRCHALPEIMLAASDRYFDPDLWDPLIMKFTHLYGSGVNVRTSTLARLWEIPAP